MASVSSLNSEVNSSPYLDQIQNPSTNTTQSKSTTSNSSVDSAKQSDLGNSDSNKTSSFPSTSNQNLPSIKINNSLTQESQFAADSTKDLGDYGHLSTGQKKLVDDLTNRQNTTNKTQLSPEKFYNSLETSQKSTFEGVTNALENTTIISKDGKKTNGLDTIDRVDIILGEKKGSNNGTEQFRLFVTLKDGVADNVKTAKNFHDAHGHGEDYKESRQLDGGEPSIQFCFSKDGKKADIDVDYESKNVLVNLFTGFKHLQPSTSDVRHADHFEKHNERFASEPGQQPLVKKY